MNSASSHGRGTVFVVGAGAVGVPLAVALAHRGREAVLVRARPAAARGTIAARVRFAGKEEPVRVPLEQVPLRELRELSGTVVLAVKSHANPELAAELATKRVSGDLVVMQNGLAVERPFLSCGFDAVLRCVLYVTSQPGRGDSVEFRQIASSPIGIVTGAPARLAGCVSTLSTDLFSFHGEPLIEREVWGKTVINAAFNSICPLLEFDNGLFARDAGAAAVARSIVAEGVALGRSRGLALDEENLMSRVMEISRGSGGVMISTLQDILAGRETEIGSLNLELARMGGKSEPPQVLAVTEALGLLVLAKSRARARKGRAS